MTKNAVQNCAKCGMCLNVCPVYTVLNEEQASPRARLHLIKAYEQNKLSSSPLLKEIISKCLMCGSCAAICPLGINHYSEFMEMRKRMVEDHGEKLPIKSLVYLLAKEQRLKFANTLARVGQNIVPEQFKEKYKLGNIPLKRLPVLNKKPFRSALPETIFPNGEQKGTVIYFTGCATNYIYEDTGFSAVNILSHLGYRILIPETQTCCAIPMLFHGFVEKARQSIKENIAALSQDSVDAIIVDCATCGTALKKEYNLLCDKLDLDKSAVDEISSKVTDIGSFMLANADFFNFKKIQNPKSLNLTYHLPCHLKNSFGNTETMETLLKIIPNINYIKAADFDSCCGGGGTFFYEYPEVSKKIGNKKKETAIKTGADLWLTDCPVCRINLSGNLDENDSLKVVHPVSAISSLLKPKT
ncbi:(Fe-S)-binding protein [Desulfobacula sp.]|uniref:(Fe-S)-binding protein n=1 Tax=Desulfobacula sp. TaxID=2593537 RepID=UPI00261F6070|nr:(Fe-S)-binding protein [Desulfobacula sp.]